MENPEKLAPNGTQDEDKENKTTTQQALDIMNRPKLPRQPIIKLLIRSLYWYSKNIQTRTNITNKHIQTRTFITNKHIQTRTNITNKHIQTRTFITNKHIQTRTFITNKYNILIGFVMFYDREI